MATEMDQRREKALVECERAAKQRLEAQQEYEDAVLHAHDMGCRNTTIARRMGVSETNVRMFIKRKKEKRDALR